MPKVVADKWYNRHSNNKAVVHMELGLTERIIGIIIGIFTLGGLFYKLCKGIKNCIKRRREKNMLLERILEGQNCLREKMEEMDTARSDARVDIWELRMAQIAVVAAVKELGKSLGVEINGEVRKYHEKNIESLRDYVRGD